MLFRVVETSRVDGKARITVEAEDSGVALLLQFFETSSQFAHAFRYRAEADLRRQDRAAERIAAEPARRAFGKEVLSLYRSMKGVPQHKRYQRIRELMKARGFDYTYSNVEGLVTRAIHDEQDEKVSKSRPKENVGSTADQREGNNTRVPTRALSSRPDHRVRLVSSQGVRACRREAGREMDTTRRRDAGPSSIPPPRNDPPSAPGYGQAGLGGGKGRSAASYAPQDVIVGLPGQGA